MFKLETFTLKFTPRAPQECTFVNRVDGFLHVSNPNSSFEVDPPPVSSYLTVFPEGDLSVTYSGALYEAARAWNPFGRGGCTRPPWATGDCSPFHGPTESTLWPGNTRNSPSFKRLAPSDGGRWRETTSWETRGRTSVLFTQSRCGAGDKKKKKKMLAGTTRHLPPEP